MTYCRLEGRTLITNHVNTIKLPRTGEIILG